MLCVVNVSEGRRADVLERLRSAGGDDLLDVHVDPWHHRSVWTVVGANAPRRLAAEAVASIDLRRHAGVHPRLGAIDVVPFVGDGDVDARDAFVDWATRTLRLPAARYGHDGPDLPTVRRTVRRMLLPHPTAGLVAVGARPPLVAYNVWLAEGSDPRPVAAAVRGPAVRALGLAVGGRPQVSMNLVDPSAVGPADAYDAVAALAPVAGAELVGLLAEAVLQAIPADRWDQLDLSSDRTVEARLAERSRRV